MSVSMTSSSCTSTSSLSSSSTSSSSTNFKPEERKELATTSSTSGKVVEAAKRLWYVEFDFFCNCRIDGRSREDRGNVLVNYLQIAREKFEFDANRTGNLTVRIQDYIMSETAIMNFPEPSDGSLLYVEKYKQTISFPEQVSIREAISKVKEFMDQKKKERIFSPKIEKYLVLVDRDGVESFLSDNDELPQKKIIIRSLPSFNWIANLVPGIPIYPQNK